MIDRSEQIEATIDAMFDFGKWVVDGARGIAAKNAAKLEQKPEPKKQEVPTLPAQEGEREVSHGLPPFLSMERVAK